MKSFAIALAITIASTFATANVFAQEAHLTQKDLATADGSLRVGLHNGQIFGVLTATDSTVVLNPDSWASDDESKNWNLWLVDFDNDLFSKWADAEAPDGQRTVHLKIAPDKTFQQEPGTFLAAAVTDPQQQQFQSAITRSIEQALKGASPMPRTQNPLKEIRIALTFMRDSKMVPRFGREQFGFMAVLNPVGDNVAVHGRMKEGRSPGIQIISDRDGGTISVTEDAAFRAKCSGDTAPPF